MKPDNFPNNAERERTNTLAIYEKLYDNEQEEIFPLHPQIKSQFKDASSAIYISHALPEKITSFYSELVQGDLEELQISTADDNLKDNVDEITEVNEIADKVYDLANDQSRNGFVVLYGRVNANNQYIIERASQDQYFPQDDGSIIFATWEKDKRMPIPEGEDDRDIVVFLQKYSLADGVVNIQRAIYTTTDRVRADRLIPPEQYLNVYYEGYAETEQLQLDELPIAQIDNNTRKDGFGRSDYANIFPQVAEINQTRTEVAVQLIKNGDPILVTPPLDGSAKNEDGSLKDVKYLETAEGESGQAHFVANDNPLLENAETHIMSQVQIISVLSEVPFFALTGTAQPERVESLQIRLHGAERRTKAKRARIRAGLKKMYRVGLKLTGALPLGDDFDFVCEFSEVLPRDMLQTALAEQAKRDAGLTSRQSSIRRLEGYSQERLEEELQTIATEDRESGVANPDAPPVF